MSYMSKFNVVTWTAYDISNFSIYTKSKYESSIMQNSEVMIEAKSLYFSSSKHKNHILASRAYIGVIEVIWEIY